MIQKGLNTELRNRLACKCKVSPHRKFVSQSGHPTVLRFFAIIKLNPSDMRHDGGSEVHTRYLFMGLDLEQQRLVDYQKIINSSSSFLNVRNLLFFFRHIYI